MSNGGLEVPFSVDDWVIDLHNAGLRGQYTGRVRKAGPHIMVELRYPDGSTRSRPLQALQAAFAEGRA